MNEDPNITYCIDALIDALTKARDTATKATDLRLPKLKLQQLFNGLPKPQKNAFLQAYNNLVNKFLKGITAEGVDIIIIQLTEWLPDAETIFPATVNKEKKEKVIRVADDTEILGRAFYNLCKYEAVFDLISGNLHRLDPVIQDSGCQWRVPFVLDAHHEIIDICGEWDRENEIKVAEIVDLYFDLRSNGINLRSFLVEYDGLRRARNSAPNKGKEQSKQELALLNFVSDSITKFEKHLTIISTHKCPFAVFVNFVSVELDDWSLMKSTGVNASDYLTLCKLLTVNRCRRMDNFGLSGVRIDYYLPLTGPQEKNFYITLAGYSKAYMLYVANEIVKVDEVDEGKISISAIIKELIGTHLIRTSQNGAEYDTHVFYAGLRSLFAYQSLKGQPIIIDIRRLTCVTNGGVAYVEEKDGEPDIRYNDAEYTLNGGAILYFEPDGDGNFIYVPEPTEEQMNTVGMCVECFSIYRSDIDAPEGMDLFFSPNFIDYLDTLTYRCSIVDMIMCSSSFHSESPSPILIPGINKYKTSHDEIDVYLKSLYVYTNGPEMVTVYPPVNLLAPQCTLFGATIDTCHLWTEKKCFEATVRYLGTETIAYKTYVGGREYGIRVDGSVVFTPVHIYGCTYAIKLREMTMLRDKHGGTFPVMPRLMSPKDEYDKED